MTSQRISYARGAHPTIGFFTDTLEEPGIWRGISAVARQRNAHVICFVGGLPRDPNPLAGPRNVLYQLASAESVDGLIFWAGAFNSYLSIEEVREFCGRYRPLPMVSIALELQGIPSMVLDNYQGMRQAMIHLIEVHRRRRIAVIRGPEGHQEADIRHAAYVDTLADHNLPFDQALSVPGGFEPEFGLKAISWLLDERQTDFDAVVAMDDGVAHGAMQALQARGRAVPEDVAVVGFDDQAFARHLTPPLTTVRTSSYRQGQRAAELVLAQIEGETVAERVTMPLELIVRQSCGCLSPSVQLAAAGPARARRKPAASRLDLTRSRARILAGLQQDLAPTLRPEWLVLCLDTLAAELGDGRRPRAGGGFLPAVEQIGQSVLAAGGDILVLEQLVSALRREVLPYVRPLPGVLTRAEDLWQQARVMIAEAARRAEAFQRMQFEQQARVLQGINQLLLGTVGQVELMGAIAEGLPRLGIDGCCLALYEKPAAPAEWARLILAYDRKQRVHLEAEGRPFPALQLAPRDVWRGERCYSFVLEALFFGEEQMGFALFEAGPPDGSVYEFLRAEISSALKGTQLHAQVLELSLTDSLTKLSNRRFAEIILQEEAERTRRHNRDLAVIMIDTDYLKKYNDTYGHLAGDEILRQVARCIETRVRRGQDVAARYGGDEFVVILPETTGLGAQAVAEAIRAQVAASAQGPLKITVSLGVAALRGAECVPQRLLEMADQALYEAKRLGRNRVSVSTFKGQAGV
jgi:diguanylate cyclase (GGDEF)-like protein